jgi:hypothetical protein
MSLILLILGSLFLEAAYGVESAAWQLALLAIYALAVDLKP